MTAYYNEIEPYCAAWLQNLMDAGHIAPGVIDTRSIEDVRPDELAGYTQCHFFAGIGVWSLALRASGWPDSRPAWTGSCPCQPFSAAGKGAGFADERHLWPAWQHLINQCRPAVIFGEQVASKAVDAWIDLVHADMEGMGYAFECVPFPSAGVGAPNIRDRTYWVADADSGQRDGFAVVRGHECNGANAGRTQGVGSSAACGDPSRLADPRRCKGCDGLCTTYCDDEFDTGLADEWLADADMHGRVAGSAATATARHGHTVGAASGNDRHERPGPTNGFWADADWLGCTDGKWRPTQSTHECMADGFADSLGYVRTGDAWSLNPLIQGAKNRVGRLRAYGNAICAPAAEAFIRSYLDASHG